MLITKFYYKKGLSSKNFSFMANYKKISDKVEELTISNPKTERVLKWLNVAEAGKNEVNYLRRRYNFDLAHARSALASVSFQRPMIFQGPKYLFLILHFPALENGKIISAEIDFFIGHGFLITAHNKNLPALTEFFNLGKKSPDVLLAYSLESSAILLYEILNRLLEGCYQLIDESSLALNEVEELIFSDRQREAVEKILNLRRNIINLRKIMQNHKNILQKLMNMESSLVERKAIRNYFDGLVNHSKRIWEMLDNQKEMVEVLNSTNESFLNNRLTTIMKTLTIFSVIIFPLTLLATLFSMRTADTPLVNHPHGFWIIIGIMVIGALGMLFFFNRKRWL